MCLEILAKRVKLSLTCFIVNSKAPSEISAAKKAAIYVVATMLTVTSMGFLHGLPVVYVVVKDDLRVSSAEAALMMSVTRGVMYGSGMAVNNCERHNKLFRNKNDKLCYISYSKSPSVITQSNLWPSRKAARWQVLFVDDTRGITWQYNTACHLYYSLICYAFRNNMVCHFFFIYFLIRPNLELFGGRKKYRVINIAYRFIAVMRVLDNTIWKETST